jgi:hypothetical protein
MNISIETANRYHIHDILANLRDYDKDVFDGITDPIGTVFREVQKSSEAFAGLIDDRVLCLWGVHTRTILSNAVYLWVLTSKLVEEHPFLFVRRSKILIDSLLEEYESIDGHVLVTNSMSVKWIKWLGANLQEGPVAGVMEFTLRRA